MADRHLGPVRVLRWLAVATAGGMALASTAIKFHWPPWLVLGTIQLHALCAAPMWSISTTIVLSRLQDAQQEFGPLRAMATVGWMAGCWLVSALNADTSTLAGYSGVLPSLLSEQFPVETRAIGVSLGFSTAVSIFGGFAPFVATWLIAQTGNPLSPSYYLIFTALLSLIALIAIQRRSRPAARTLALSGSA